MKNGKLYRMPMNWYEHITIPLTRLLNTLRDLSYLKQWIKDYTATEPKGSKHMLSGDAGQRLKH